MLRAAGIDIGSSTVKVAIVQVDGADEKLLAVTEHRIRRRDPKHVVEEAFEEALHTAGLRKDEVDYVATTGEGELAPFRTGHFYSMTAHARGAHFLEPAARSAIDIGALHTRAIKMDERAKVLDYRMTSQCASGTGQFVENIARYLGVALDEVGPLSQSADNPEKCSGICAVLAETDVINMVSRGITIPNILKGIHVSMASRFAKLLVAAKAASPVLITGGLSKDSGLTQALQECLRAEGSSIEVLSHPKSIAAGAIGAALWGAFRAKILKDRGISVSAADAD